MGKGEVSNKVLSDSNKIEPNVATMESEMAKLIKHHTIFQASSIE